MKFIKIDNREIEYDIIRTNRKKTIGIQIDPDEGVIVRSPKRVSDQDIEDLLKRKSKWIIRKMDEMAKIKEAPEAKNFVSGEEFLYLGRKYKLLLSEDRSLEKAYVKLSENKIKLSYNPDIDNGDRKQFIRAEIIKWYYQEFGDILLDRIEKFQPQIGKSPLKIRIKNQKKRWGSCSSKGNLNFNWKLIMAPIDIIDYLVVHEMVHLIHPNHSRDFWNKLASIIPDYKERQEWLKINQRLLNL
ncbi:M48 family metallopeptidase [Natronospora cellulosivora (SeqCode)]